MQNVYLSHHGIKGQRWGVRRWQNPDGSLTNAGKRHYSPNYAINDAIQKVGAATVATEVGGAVLAGVKTAKDLAVVTAGIGKWQMFQSVGLASVSASLSAAVPAIALAGAITLGATYAKRKYEQRAYNNAAKEQDNARRLREGND